MVQFLWLMNLWYFVLWYFVADEFVSSFDLNLLYKI